MLIILYGCLDKVGKASRQFFTDKGYELVEKYNYAPNEIAIKARHKPRNLVSKEEFYEKTDSLFRYELSGLFCGFNQTQILDAVTSDTKKLLTLTTTDVSFLRSIKNVYGDAIKLIYCYIDKNILKEIVHQLSDLNPGEKEYRLEIGTEVRNQYVKNSDIFDNVVIFSGENSEFNLNSLILQYDNILKSIDDAYVNQPNQHDVFLSYAHKDIDIVKTIRKQLIDSGLDVVDDSDMPFGVDVAEYNKKAIASSKIIVPIITNNTIESDFAEKEIEAALNIAEESATVVIPLFLEHGLDYRDSCAISQLSVMPGPGFDTDVSPEEVGKGLAERIQFLFSGLKYLEWYSEQVNNYLFVKEFKHALEIQKKHLELCIDLSNASQGKYASMEVIFCSKIKLTSILIDMKNWSDALNETIDAIQMLDDDSSQGVYNTLKDQFAICCVGCAYDEDKVQSIINEYINIYRYDEAYLGRIMHYFNYDLCKELMEEFKYRNRRKESTAIQEDTPTDGEIVKIAQYGEAAMEVFSGLINAELTEQIRGNLIEGYQRVLNYCMQLGLSEDISAECIRKIAELKETNTIKTKGSSKIAGALKVYLGQAAPGSGNYDVFVSFKSVDEALARKIYDFLKQNGKEVFFSRESLPQLGQSEYEDAIYEALEHSKHFVLVGSNPEYFKTDWVSREWKYYNNKNRESEKPGNLIIILPSEYVDEKDMLPPQLRYNVEKVRMVEFKERLLSYLR